MTNEHSVQKTEAIERRNWLVIGGLGQLGTELVTLLRENGAVGRLTSIDRDEIDITDAEVTKKVIDQWLADAPDGEPIVINAAAYTAVDNAESDEATALAVNARGPRNIAAALDGRARLIHVSTDYVFPGDATSPYRPNDPTGPKTAYGRTKDEGDVAVRDLAPDTGYVVRTAWVYGAYGPNFVKTMTKFAGERDELQVVSDQVGSPTWTRHLALGLIDLALSDAPAGYYHCTGGGDCSWWEFTRAIFEELGLDPDRVKQTTSDQFVRPAPRPAYSVLSATEWRDAGLAPMPHWRAALTEAFARDGAALGKP